MYKLLIVEFLLGSLAGCQVSVEQKAARIHKKIFTIDSHTDTPLLLMDDHYDLSVEHDAKKGEGKVDFPKMQKGGLDAAFFAVFIGQGARDSASLQKAFHRTDTIFTVLQNALNNTPQLAELATRSEQGPALAKQHKLAIYTGIENGYGLGNHLKNVDYFYNRGARYITLVHTKNNDLADSSTDPKGPEHQGLSEFGKQVVKRMNELGIMVDVSHASDSAFYDVLAISKTPVIASHSCARAICDNPRNLTDSMLVALAKNGGVIQMCILSDYVKVMPSYPARDSANAAFDKRHSNWANYTDAQRKQGVKEWFQLDVDFPPNLASVSDVVDHIDHIVKVAGIDHVGIGTDFDGGGGVQGCFDASELGNITLELVKRGYSEDDIAKIWGLNFMRVFNQVEAYANGSI